MLIHRLLTDQRGTTAIEYGFIVALIVLVAFTGIKALGGSSTGVIGTVSSKVQEYMK